MKQVLLLIPILFYLTLTSQNSKASLPFSEKGADSFDDFQKHLVNHKKLTVIEFKSKPRRLSWKVIESSTSPSEDFDSFRLKKQILELNQATPFNISHNPTTERYIRVFLRDQKERLSEVFNRADYYFPILEKYLDQYNLPLEIKYLAIVESGLNPKAVSSSGAKGLWQFMYGTAREQGLKIDSYVDERFEYEKSTEAACRYLNLLFETFGDWDLVLAAYNAGPANVTKAIKRSGGKRDYWALRPYLPQETRGYLPAFYATFYLYTHRNYHNIDQKVNTVRDLETDTIHIKRPLSLSKTSEVLNVNKQLLEYLNPQYKTDIIPQSGNHRYTLRINSSLVDKFLDNEYLLYDETESMKSAPIESGYIPIRPNNSYLVKKGDHLYSIARKHKISVAQIMKWNGLENPFLIEGQRLVIVNN